ncbi:hypothetical protein Q7P35_002826 [Cladosporium inversicolor]
MCHSRSTDKLARFAARSFPDHFLRTLTDISAAPQDDHLLHAANMPLLPGTERYYHLDGSRDDSSEIAFLAGDGRRLHLLGIPLGLSDPETQHDIANVSLLRRRIWLNGGLEEGQDEDFRFVVDGRGTWIVRLRSGDTPPDSATWSSIDEEDEEDEGGADEYINLLDIPDASPRAFPSPQFEGLHLTRHQQRIQRRRVANTRLYDITTRINILRGIPDASTRLPSRFISSLDDIANLADQLRTMPRHTINEETFGMFDRALDQLERTASLATLTSRRRGATSEDSDVEPDQSTDSLSTAESTSTSSTQEGQPTSLPAEDPATTTPRTRHDRMITLNTIISSLATFLSSPDPPPSSVFSPIRRAFDEITAILEQASDDPLDETLIDSVSAAQSLFWMLARRAYPETQTADVAVRGHMPVPVPVRRSRFRSALRSSGRRWSGVGKLRLWK